MDDRFVVVKKDVIKSIFACPLCNQFMEEITTLLKCLHSFCRKCIYDQITQEELKCCPVCKVDFDVSITPLENTRPNNIMQNIRNVIFPPEKEKNKALAFIPLDHQETSSSLDTSHNFVEKVGQSLSHETRLSICNEGEKNDAEQQKSNMEL